MALLEALRALSSFDPPAALPQADFGLLGDVLAAHGLAPLASYQLEHTRLGAGAPTALRERLLGHYQAVANDNVLRMVTLRGALRHAGGIPVVLLDGAAYVDWLYPHLAFRPVGDLRLALRAEDGARFAEALGAGGMRIVRTEGEGAPHGAGGGAPGERIVFSDGKLELSAQEGLFAGAPAEGPLFERGRPYPAFGVAAARPSAEDALLATVGEQALEGLLAPLITFVDLRELLKLPLDAAYVAARARALNLQRGLFGALALVARFFPEVAEPARALAPALGPVERLAVEGAVEAAADPAKLRHLRGVDRALRAVVAP